MLAQKGEFMTRKVLIVDWDDDDVSYLRRWIDTQNLDLEIEAVNNGRTALEIFEEHLPDFVIMEIIIPVYTGWKTALEMKLICERTGHVSVLISLTSIGQSLNRQFSPLQGFNHVFDKPLNNKVKESLLEILKS